jgi:hypothetical protein|tara:strand:- start:15473 stop:15679 length:207 start_codon:yes stop_codon:yes gene_type:complete
MSKFREITVKFDTKCFETGRIIPKGAQALQSLKTALFYSWESEMYTKYREREWDSVDLAKGIAKFFRP